MKSFLVGLGIGLGLGVLFAPMSGEETRNNLAQRASDLADGARDTLEQGGECVRAGNTAIRDAAQNTTQQPRTCTEAGVEPLSPLFRRAALRPGPESGCLRCVPLLRRSPEPGYLRNNTKVLFSWVVANFWVCCLA